MRDIAIIGAGFTGMATAAYLNSKNVKVLEASNNLGGILRDYNNTSGTFFSSCQYLSSDSLSLEKFKLTDDFYKFEHTYGSYTDIFENIEISKNFAGPVYSGALTSKLIQKLKFKNLEDRLNAYPEKLSIPLIKWFKKIGVDTLKTHHTAIDAFQASRIYCKNMFDEINSLKKNSTLADQIYGLTRNDLNLKKIYSFLPASGYNIFFNSFQEKFKEKYLLKNICKPIRVGSKICLKQNDNLFCPDLVIWTANPATLFKHVFDKQLDSTKFKAEILYGYLDKKIDKPFYIQVFSKHSNILRIYIYNINGKGCFTIEKAFDYTDDKTVLQDAKNIMNNFFSYRIFKLAGRSKNVRYYVYSIRDFELLEYFQLNNDIENLIFTNFLAYGRDDKVFSILKQLPKEIKN